MRGKAALPDKPDRADSRKRTEFDMQRGRRGDSKEEEKIAGGELGVDLTVEGERSRGIRATGAALSLRENRLFGADQLDRNPGLGMAPSGVYLGMHGRNRFEGEKKKERKKRKIAVPKGQIWDKLQVKQNRPDEEKFPV